MSKYKRIPVIRSQGVVLKEEKESSVGKKVGWLILLFTIMLAHVWLSVETNSTMANIRTLESQRDENIHENDKLRAEVVRLSSFGRIQQIAQKKLGLIFIPNDQIVEISKR